MRTERKLVFPYTRRISITQAHCVAIELSYVMFQTVNKRLKVLDHLPSQWRLTNGKKQKYQFTNSAMTWSAHWKHSSKFNFNYNLILTLQYYYLPLWSSKSAKVPLNLRGFLLISMIFFIKFSYTSLGITQFQFNQRLKKRVFLFRTAVLNKFVLFNHYFSHIRNRSVWVFVIYRWSPCQVNFSPAKMGKAKRSQNKQRYEISSHETIPYNTKR